MAITFLDEEEDIVAAAEPPKVEGGITFLDEEEPAVPAVKPAQEPATPVPVEAPKITFLDEEPQVPSIGGLTVPPAPEAPKPKPIVETIGQLEGIKNAAMNAFDSSRQAMAVAGGVSPEEAESISKLEYQKEARKLSPAYSEYLQAEGIDAVKAFAKNPFEITTNIVAEGLAGSLYSLGAGVAAGGVAAAATAATGVGAPLAPAAFLGGQIGGTFAGSLATEYGGKVLEELQNAGMDIKDPESIQKFFSDEKLMEDARSQALKRGVPVAIFDGVSAGIGGRLARLPIQALTKTPTRLAITEGLTQAALGGGGEIAGALAAGEEIQPKAVFGEVIGEVGPAAAEITVGRIAERLAKTPEQKKFDQNVLAAQVATRASQDVAPASADALERQVQDTMASAAETPEQRVVRLQKEAKAGAGIELEEETANRFFESARSIVVPQIRQIDPEVFRTELNTIETRIAENAFTVADLDQTQFKTILSPEAYTQISTLFEENPQLAAQTLRQVIERELGIGGGGGGEGEPPVTGLPPVEPTPPVTPAPEAAVAPVEPVATAEEVAQPPTPEVVPKAENAVVEAEQKSEQESDTVKVFRGVAEAGALPTGGAFFTDSERDASAYAQLAALRKATEENEDFNDIVSEVMAEEGANDITDLSINTIKSIIEGNNIQVGDISEGAVLRGNIRLGNVLNLESFGSEVGSLPETWNELNELGLVPETWESLDEDVQDELSDKYRGKAFYSLLEGEVNLNDQFAKGIDTIVFTDQNTEGKGTHRTYLTKAAEQFAQEAAPAAVEPTTAEARFSQFVQPKERPDLAEFPEFKSFEMDVRGVPVRFDIDTTKSNENTLYLESFRVPREERRQGIGREAMTNMLRWADENNITLKGEALTAPADRQYRTPQEIRDQGYMTSRELFSFYQTLGWERDPEGPKKTMGIPMVYRPKPAAEVAPAIPQLEPLRRVARAEQTEEDVAGLVDAGFVEVYNGQPVLTQAGLEALPEAERPRLTPEARKIQIDTRTSEAAAEAISKNLRIGVDQVPVDVRMPAGWTLEGDIYVPPQPQAVAPAPTPEVREARREPPVEIQQQYAPKTDEEQQSFDRASTNKILARSPQLAVAAVRLKNGEITAGEYADLVDVLDPFVVKGAEPVPTNEKIYQYMSQTAGGKPTSEQGKEKLSKIGAFKEDGTQRIPNGKLAEFRIDIPTYNESTKNGDTVYSITGHEPVPVTAKQVGKTIAHLGIAKITNPQFITRTISGKGDAIQIAMGAGKFPLATVKGNYEAITELPADINDPNVWTEAGYNPIRSSFFVDVRSKKALVGGTEAIMVGSRVFVKNAQLEVRPIGITMGERYARRVQMGRAGMEPSAVEARLQELGFPTGGIIRVVNEPDADFEGRTIILDGKVIGIELNSAALKDNAAIDRVLNHEFAESANADGALNKLVERLTPKEKKEINDTITRLRYEERARTTEEAARAIEALAEAWKGRGFFTRAVARVEAWASKLGFKLTRRAAEYIAARNLAEVNENVRKWHIGEAMANIKGARRVVVDGVQAVLIPPTEMRVAYSIAAYHGTPHEIKGRFQVAKIGTGEGATAYGWGLYFAENIEVAKEYQRNLSKGQYALSYEGVPVNELPTDQKNAILKIAAGISRETVIADLETSLRRQEASKPEDWAVPENRERVIAELKSSIEEAKKIKPNEIKPRTAGNLYRVELDVNNDQLLDWDVTFAEQSEQVKNAIRKILGDDVVDFILKSTNKNRTGGWFYEMVGGTTDAQTEAAAKKAASELLLSNGIKGVRYLDAGSREEGGTHNYVVFDENVIKITGRNGKPMDIRESRREPEAIPTFTEGTPEAATLKEMEASMAKVDAASEAKGGKPETQKISDIAANWMDQGGDERALQDAIVENTNLTPANAARVAKAIARQYDIQQSIATAFLETQTGLSVEALPEGVALPKEVDPDRPKPVMQRLFDVFMGVRVPPVKITVNEKTALKQQIRLKAAANRAAKAAQKETSDQVIEVIKAMDLRGGVRPKQVQALAKRAAKVIWTNEKSLETFADYAAKVVENANYDADLREAKAAQARAKQLSKQKKIAMGPQREMLDNISKIAVNRLDDPRMYADVVNYYLRGFKAVLSPDYVVVPDSEMTSYLSQMQSEATRNQRDLDRAVNERLAEKYGVDIDDLNSVLEAADIISQLEANENREAMDNLLTEKAIETRDGLKAYDQTPLRADQRKLVDAIMKVDPKALDAEERQRFIRITNNIIYNNQTNGAEYFASVAKGQQSARAAAQDSDMIAKNKAWINLLPRLVSERMQRGWALELQSVADTFRNAFGKGAMAKVYKAMGMLDLNMGFTKANNTIDEIQEKIAEFHTKLEKKYKAAARNQDGLLAEGVAGFLIQKVPNKGETESIAQRRDLIRQDIANRRRSGEVDRMAMADRIETILNQIDGEGVQAVLSKLKQAYPANHESLIWYKDTLLPQYKEFLKNFDENFNDQANNYDNPDYLPIAFSKASPSLAITKEEEQVFYDQVSLTPKQSAYTIKRLDYTKLPDDRSTNRPKEISFNLRRNAFDSLSDQINKAYTSSAWQQLASFMKTPESEVVFGGQANKDFFIERLNRLRLSRMRRGSMSRGNIERAVDSLSVISRKLGTGIALGGLYQWIKQPPDQLVTALGSGGRYDLMAQNIMPKNQKAARELLRKFSIGRRGDASSGYKYINQMEGHQNRLERYFSESKWDQVKEEGSKVADVWMAALKQSDFWAASTAWMTYYEGELNKRDIKIEDWAKEAELVDTDPARQEAAAFAEQMTDIYQGSSDPTQMATFAQSGKSGWENLMKAIFVPFNSFAIQQRMRLYSDARDVLNGEKSGVGGLTGTIGGLLLFHATKRLALPVISGSIAGVLYALLGVDMDEPDEEKQKEEANKRWRQMQGEMLGNLLVGGTPQIVEAKFIDAMNYASYLISLQLESESVLNDDGEVMSFDQYAKERSPFWRYRSFDNAMSLGMLDIGLGQAEQAILQTKMVATPEEMEMYTPEEQRLLYFSALSEWLYLMRLNDADFARIVSKARRDMMSAAKEREKQIKAIQSGR